MLLSVTIPGQSGTGSHGNKWVLCIPQSSGITVASSSDCSVFHPGQSLRGLTPRQMCSLCILQSQPTGACWVCVTLIIWSKSSQLPMLINWGYLDSYYILQHEQLRNNMGSIYGMMVKILDCNLEVSEFKLRSHYDVHFCLSIFVYLCNPQPCFK